MIVLVGNIVMGVITIIAYTHIRDLTYDNDNHSSVDVSLARLQSGVLQYQNENFHVVPNVAVPDGADAVAGDTEIVVCTQTSLNNLHYINTLAKAWDGHISIAVLTYDDDLSDVLYYIILLRICSVDVQRKVSFHLVYPISQKVLKSRNLKDSNYDCQSLKPMKEQYIGQNWLHPRMRYPINILRNVAILYSKRPYVFNLDIDILPSYGLNSEMESFLKKRHEKETLQKVAYVTPCFELNATEIIPYTKTPLLEALRNGTVRIRGLETCVDCHEPVNYSRWLDMPYPSEMSNAYLANYKHFFEPYYIAARKYLPLFDDKFFGWGKDRFSQVCEMHVSGFDFVVMNNGFVLHDGFKSKSTRRFHTWREQYDHNVRFYEEVFTQDLKMKHPYSPRSC